MGAEGTAAGNMTEDLEAMVRRAAEMFWHGPDYPKARPVLETAVDRDPNHLVAQWFLFQCELIDGDLPQARARGELLVKLSPNNHVMILSWVRALAASGDLDAARAVIAQHLIRVDLASDRRNIGANPLIEAVLFQLVGQEDASFETSRALCRENDVTLIDWSTVERGGEIRAALKHMRAKVRNRDICIFGRGPSIKDLEADPGRLGGHDFVPFVLSEFQEVAERVLAKVGKTPGLVCMTSQNVVRACADNLRALYSSDDFIALTIPAFLDHQLRNSEENRTLAEQFLSDSHRVFAYRCQAELNFPVPCDPLHFPTVNTLLHALGLAVLLEPRRIFLFGFEGKVSAAGEYYYAEQDKASTLGERWQNRTARWLWWDSFRFNHVAPCFINHLHLLHDAQFPLIYNVCKDSALTCFPRIGLDDYSRLVRGER